MKFDKLFYTTADGLTVEFSTESLFHVNLDVDVTGLSDVKTTIYRTQVVNVDGSTETGFRVDERPIVINGTIKAATSFDRELLIAELQKTLSPFSNGTLRYEGLTIKEIDVRPEQAPQITKMAGTRWARFTLSLVALNPNWRATADIETPIESSGTSIYYDGSRACGIEIEITAGADNIDMESLTVTNGSTVETITFRTGGGVLLDTDDVLVVNTAPGGISITLNGTNALERIDFTNTIFPKLYPGSNSINWSANGDEADFTVAVRYTPLYLGK